VCVSLSTNALHNTTQNSSDNYPCPIDNHHSSDDVYWRGHLSFANAIAAVSLVISRCALRHV